MKHLYLITLVVLSHQLSAQWSQVGTNLGFTNGGTGIAFNPSNNEIYVAYNDGAVNAYKVEKFDGTSWSQVGTNLGFADVGGGIGVAFNPSNNEVYVAYSDDAANVYKVEKFDGTSWSQVGANIGSSSFSGIGIAFNPSNNEVYVAYADAAANTYKVEKFDGTSWSQVGTNVGNTGGGNYDAGIAFNPSNNEVYVAYGDVTNVYKVEKFDGTSWSQVGTDVGFANGGGIGIAFNPSNNEVYVIYGDGGANAYKIEKNNGTSWSQIGTDLGFSGNNGGADIAFNPSTLKPYVSYADGAANAYKVETFNLCNLSAAYTFTDNGNGDYSFTNTSIGNFNQSHWAFGDGTIDSTENSNHLFTTNGNFTVVLTIKDSTVQGDSCISYYIDTINVTGVANPLQCHSGFVMYPDTTGNVTVVNSSTGNNLTYLWDFGDGNNSALQNPSHTYANAGPFYLCLTVDDNNGCVDMYCDSIGENGVIFNRTGGFSLNVVTTILTGIDNNANLNSALGIYPNPTSNQLTIDTELNINTIKITDMLGKTIKTINTGLNIINVADLLDGIYFIQVMTGEKTITKKFVKQ